MRALWKRFTIPSYLMYTAYIKSKALTLRWIKSKNPYFHFKDKIKYNRPTISSPIYVDQYLSFDYMDSNMARNYYKNRPSVIHDIMIGIISYNDHIATGRILENDKQKILDIADKVVQSATIIGDKMYFYTEESYPKFDLEGKRYSGITQGKAASFFIRCYKLSTDKKYLEWARKSLLAATQPTASDGIMRELSDTYIWIEEYSSPSPSMVLNGYIFYIIALGEYSNQDKDDRINKLFTDCMTSLIAWLPQYKVGNTLLYSMYHWDMCNIHYLSVVHYQIMHLNKMISHPELRVFEEWLAVHTNNKVFLKMIS